MTKYIFVTGGVVSGLGKGITAASLGMMLKAKGLKVISQKLDPYLNMDPGQMSPVQHGEVFVTEDGAETDLDLGHYERFTDVNLNKFSNITQGKIYFNIQQNDKKGVYQGETIQVIPHVTNEIKKFVYSVGKKIDADIVITEIGGTTGDIESLPFIEAIRQVGNEVGRENCLYIHVTLAPILKSSGEMKTKPIQHSVKELRSLGIQPNVVIVRCSGAIDEETRGKISMFCSVEPDCVIENRDVKLLYEAPVMLEESNLTQIVSRELNLNSNPPEVTLWKNMLSKAYSRNKEVKIALVGRYVKMFDAYMSAVEALTHAGIENSAHVKIEWLDSAFLSEKNVAAALKDINGVIIPGDMGEAYSEGSIAAVKYCREKNVPLLGICCGAQTMAVEFARNVIGIKNAGSRQSEPLCEERIFDITGDPAFSETFGVRLGAFECVLKDKSLIKNIYKADTIFERHRNRYEFNGAYIEQFESKGMNFSAFSLGDTKLVEAMELSANDFHLGVQFHPEFKSRPHKPHPIYVSFIAAALKK